MAFLLALGMILMFCAGMIFMRELMIYKYPRFRQTTPVRKSIDDARRIWR